MVLLAVLEENIYSSSTLLASINGLGNKQAMHVLIKLYEYEILALMLTFLQLGSFISNMFPGLISLVGLWRYSAA